MTDRLYYSIPSISDQFYNKLDNIDKKREIDLSFLMKVRNSYNPHIKNEHKESIDVDMELDDEKKTRINELQNTVPLSSFEGYLTDDDVTDNDKKHIQTKESSNSNTVPQDRPISQMSYPSVNSSSSSFAIHEIYTPIPSHPPVQLHTGTNTNNQISFGSLLNNLNTPRYTETNSNNFVSFGSFLNSLNGPRQFGYSEVTTNHPFDMSMFHQVFHNPQATYGDPATIFNMSMENVKQPLTKHAFDSISNVKYINIKNMSDTKEDKCSICLTDFEDEDNVKYTECCHFFHPECLAGWTKEHHTCPICRVSLGNYINNTAGTNI
jgi:hypothetical protein